MSIGSVVGATFFLLVLVGAGATYGWANADTIWHWWWAVAIVLIILVTLTVSNPRLAPFTGIIYSLTQGAFIGALSKQYVTFYHVIIFLA